MLSCYSSLLIVTFCVEFQKNEEILTTLSLLELSQTNPKHVENMLQMSIGG